MTIILLLGRPDAPTDGLADYCGLLGPALEARGTRVSIARVAWQETGWWRALWRLRRDARAWRGQWVLVHYTALQWSARAVPVAVPVVLWLLRRAGARVATVFHDSGPYPPRTDAGPLLGTWDLLRRAMQRRVMRAAARRSAVAIVTVQPSCLAWVPPDARVVHLPVGSSIPPPEASGTVNPAGPPVVSVFAFTGPPHLASEVAVIAAALRHAAVQEAGLKLLACGRNSAEAGALLRLALDGSGATVEVVGVAPAAEITRALSRADAALFVRGQVTSGRSSAVAALACGLPIVGFAGAETAAPLTEAGVVLVPPGDGPALGEALARVVADRELNATLRRRSVAAFRHHFAWDVIAERLLAELAHD